MEHVKHLPEHVKLLVHRYRLQYLQEEEVAGDFSHIQEWAEVQHLIEHEWQQLQYLDWGLEAGCEIAETGHQMGLQHTEMDEGMAEEVEEAGCVIWQQ